MKNFLFGLMAVLFVAPVLAAQGTPAGAYGSGGGGGSGAATRLVKVNTSLDVFDRTGANLGANWTDYNNSWVPNSGSAHGTTASQWNISAYTGVTTTSAAQQSRVVVLSLNGTTDSVGAAVRISGTPHTNDSFYVCAETTTQLSLFKVTGASDSSSGTFTSLNTAKSITGAAGDVIELSIVGNTLTCNWNNWSQFMQAHDTSPLTGGLPGIEQFNNVATISSYILTNPALPSGADANIVFDGDSITGGFGIGMPWSWVVSAGKYTNPYAVNLGIPGKALGVTNAIAGDDSIESMITTGTSVVDTLFNASASKNILVVWGCTNDLATDGRTAAQCYADLQTYVSARHTAGWKVVVVPLLSENGADVKMQAFNELLFANSSFADAVVTLPTALIGTHAYSNTTFFQADGIHPTQLAAAAIIAPAIATAIGKL